MAQTIFYDSMKRLGDKASDEPLKVFKKAVENCKPMLEVKTRRVGGANYQVPIEVPQNRRTSRSRFAGSSAMPGAAPKRACRKSWRTN